MTMRRNIPRRVRSASARVSTPLDDLAIGGRSGMSWGRRGAAPGARLRCQNGDIEFMNEVVPNAAGIAVGTQWVTWTDTTQSTPTSP